MMIIMVWKCFYSASSRTSLSPAELQSWPTVFTSGEDVFPALDELLSDPTVGAAEPSNMQKEEEEHFPSVKSSSLSRIRFWVVCSSRAPASCFLWPYLLTLSANMKEALKFFPLLLLCSSPFSSSTPPPPPSPPHPSPTPPKPPLPLLRYKHSIDCSLSGPTHAAPPVGPHTQLRPQVRPGQRVGRWARRGPLGSGPAGNERRRWEGRESSSFVFCCCFFSTESLC